MSNILIRHLAPRFLSKRLKPWRILSSNRGWVAILAVLAISVFTFVAISLQMVRGYYSRTKLQYNFGAQADNIAKAGLTDAISWFKRQEFVQPVSMESCREFHPDGSLCDYPDEAFFPRESKQDTIDESIGLVKEYRLTEGTTIWARYEVRRQTTNNVLYSTRTIERAVHDITNRRMPTQENGRGLVWYIEAEGFIFREQPFNRNKIIARSRVSTEIQHLGYNFPRCAVVVSSVSTFNSPHNTRVTGLSGANSIGHYCRRCWVTMNMPSLPNWTTQLNGGIQDLTDTEFRPLGLETFLGVKPEELKQLADIYVSSVSEITANTLPAMAIIYIDGNATFNSTTRALVGGGFLYVAGNLIVNSSGISPTYYTGIIFVEGNANIQNETYILGSVIARNGLFITGSPNAADIVYDPRFIDDLRRQIGQYRERKATVFNFSGAR